LVNVLALWTPAAFFIWPGAAALLPGLAGRPVLAGFAAFIGFAMVVLPNGGQMPIARLCKQKNHCAMEKLHATIPA
jgi:hypothetical protein